jgi:predicted site-specific integrase-resolvase
MNRKLLTIKKCGEIYGISRISLINYEKKGLITPVRTPGGIRRYRVEDIEQILGVIRKENNNDRKTILYARVSTRKQEEYLKNQVKRLEEYAKLNNWNYEIIQEIASGVNENRRGLGKLLNMVERGEVERVVIEYPDRLARFGFNYLKKFLSAFGVKLIIINGNNEEKEKTIEIAGDLVAIVTSFAAKIYGKRGSKNK